MLELILWHSKLSCCFQMLPSHITAPFLVQLPAGKLDPSVQVIATHVKDLGGAWAPTFILDQPSLPLRNGPARGGSSSLVLSLCLSLAKGLFIYLKGKVTERGERDLLPTGPFPKSYNNPSWARTKPEVGAELKVKQLALESELYAVALTH